VKLFKLLGSHIHKHIVVFKRRVGEGSGG
jgi:hypothetical protein